MTMVLDIMNKIVNSIDQLPAEEEEPFCASGELTMSTIKRRATGNAFCALFEYFGLNLIKLTVWANNIYQYICILAKTKEDSEIIKIDLFN